MKKLIVGIVVTFVIFSCSSKGAGKVIPRKVLAEIYADMFVADQWTNSSTRTLKRAIDTTVIYEPIFRKYGYTADDYIVSVDFYLYDPVRYERILQNALDIIIARQDELERVREESEHTKMVESEE